MQKKNQLRDWTKGLARTPAFITLKDHKDNFQSSLPCHLLNPSKSDLHKISKSILENINQHLVKWLLKVTSTTKLFFVIK